MNILAIDTVTEMCSVALLCDAQHFFTEQLVPQQHTQVILGMVNDLFAQAGCSFSQLDAISFSRGPGSFTGLRICASVAQGFALAHELPVIPLSSLAVLAQGAYRSDNKESILACIDARKNEVYWACYQVVEGLVQLIGDERVTPPSQVSPDTSRQWHGIGTGFAAFAAELNPQTQVSLTSVDAVRYPLAKDMLPLAQQAWLKQEYVEPGLAIPTYLRDNVAEPAKTIT